MKRRNLETKTRRPVKRAAVAAKLGDDLYTGLVVYVKLILLWVCVMGGDFVLEFRLEYLYPIYLLLHNSYEAYKFQGIAFAVLLVCIVVSVDVICLGVIPSPWLYLLGSCAVWGQVGWSLTPLGPLLLLPTLLYIDGKAIRPLPTQPLCPLAAHCLGFPLVSLGFGLKAFIGGRLKQRTRAEVASQNDSLFRILSDALPFSAISLPANNNESPPQQPQQQQLQQHPPPSKKPSAAAAPRRKSLEYSDESPKFNALSSSSSSAATAAPSVAPVAVVPPVVVAPSPAAGPPPPCGCMLQKKHHQQQRKEECCYKLESEVKRLRSDLHVVRTIEAELRSHISTAQVSERSLRSEIALLQGEHESLQFRYSALLSRSQEERQSYEKRLLEERRAKDSAINKQKKASLECPGDCRRKLREAEREKEALRRELKSDEEKLLRVERELQNVKSTLLHEQKNKESTAETARLMSMLTTVQEQNAHLEASLSAETRLKLDLFSALGEARRQLSIRDAVIKAKEDEVTSARGQLVEMLAVSDFHPQSHALLQQQQMAQAQQKQHAQAQQSQQSSDVYSNLIEG